MRWSSRSPRAPLHTARIPVNWALLRSDRDWQSQRMPTSTSKTCRLGPAHLGREGVCDKHEMLELSQRNDHWSFHVDEPAAARSPCGGIVASGGHIMTLWYGSLVEIPLL